MSPILAVLFKDVQKLPVLYRRLKKSWGGNLPDIDECHECRFDLVGLLDLPVDEKKFLVRLIEAEEVETFPKGTRQNAIERLRDWENVPAAWEGGDSVQDDEMLDAARWAQRLGDDAENVRKILKYNERKAADGEVVPRDITDKNSRDLYRGSFVRRVYGGHALREVRLATEQKRIDRERGRSPQDDTANLKKLLKLTMRKKK